MVFCSGDDYCYKEGYFIVYIVCCLLYYCLIMELIVINSTAFINLVHENEKTSLLLLVSFKLKKAFGVDF